jgi:hypothetical protein
MLTTIASSSFTCLKQSSPWSSLRTCITLTKSSELNWLFTHESRMIAKSSAASFSSGYPHDPPWPNPAAAILHTHTHAYIYIYVCMCILLCVGSPPAHFIVRIKELCISRQLACSQLPPPRPLTLSPSHPHVHTIHTNTRANLLYYFLIFYTWCMSMSFHLHLLKKSTLPHELICKFQKSYVRLDNKRNKVKIFIFNSVIKILYIIPYKIYL